MIVQEKMSPLGYCEVPGLEAYNGTSLRNVRVIRVDIIKYLTEYFSEDTLNKYRNALYHIIAGYSMDTKDSRSKISNALRDLYISDEVFQLKLGKMFYFRDIDYDNLSMYDTLMESIKLSINDIRRDISFKVPHIKLICESKLYLYYSVSKIESTIKLTEITGLEVISN